MGFGNGVSPASATIVGREIQVNGVNRTVIGVMPPEFRFPEAQTEFWVPLTVTPDLQAARGSYWLTGDRPAETGRES